jgi:hypothetical protein
MILVEIVVTAIEVVVANGMMEGENRFIFLFF